MNSFWSLDNSWVNEKLRTISIIIFTIYLLDYLLDYDAFFSILYCIMYNMLDIYKQLIFYSYLLSCFDLNIDYFM